MGMLNKFLLILMLSQSAMWSEVFYSVKDLGTLATEFSEARSINQHGCVVGKYFSDGKCVDFLWIPDDGLYIMTTDADREVFPKINNGCQAVGVITKGEKGFFFNTEESQLYFFNLQAGVRMTGNPSARKEGLSIIGFNDRQWILWANHVDPYQSTHNFLLKPPESLIILSAEMGHQRTFATALNNRSDILVSWRNHSLFGSNILSSGLSIYNVQTKKSVIIDRDHFPYFGLEMNDNRLVIARDQRGTEGFWGSDLGMCSLGDFVPTALNNRGIIVGKKKSKNGFQVCLRTAEGRMIDLNKAIVPSEYPIEELTEAWAINDRGQILVTAKINNCCHAFLLDPIHKSTP